MIAELQGLFGDAPRRRLVSLGIVALAVLAVFVVRDTGGAAAQDVQTAQAEIGQLVVSAGGVGRIVEATPSIQVYPHASGHIAEILVARDERVAAGERLAVLDDGGVAAAAVEQAESELATARLERRQLITSRPTEITAARLDLSRAQADYEALFGGSQASRSRAIVLAEHSVRSAEARLERLLAPPSAADVRAAEAEVKRAEAALAVLLKPPTAPLPEVIAAAEQTVAVARQSLARAQAFGTPAEVAAAQLELFRAQAELAALRQPAPAPLPQEIAAGEAAVASARENLRRLFERNPADVQAARLDVQRARAELQQLRAGPSPKARASAVQSIEAARSRLAQARSVVGVDLARERVAAAEIRLRAARRALELLTVRAPTSGEVATIAVAPGAAVDPATAIATITSRDRLAVTVDLSEFDVAQVRVGQSAEVHVDALGGETYRGTVLFVALAGVDSNGIVTFPVEIGLRADAALRPGMNVSVRIVVAHRRKVVRVPLEAVHYDEDDRPSVVVVDPESGEEKERSITLGVANNTHAEVVSGLRAGAEVVLAETQAGEEEEE